MGVLSFAQWRVVKFQIAVVSRVSDSVKHSIPSVFVRRLVKANTSRIKTPPDKLFVIPSADQTCFQHIALNLLTLAEVVQIRSGITFQ